MYIERTNGASLPSVHSLYTHLNKTVLGLGSREATYGINSLVSIFLCQCSGLLDPSTLEDKLTGLTRLSVCYVQDASERSYLLYVAFFGELATNKSPESWSVLPSEQKRRCC